MEALNLDRCYVVETMTRHLREHHQELFGSDTLSSSEGVGLANLYQGSTKMVCDVLAGTRGSISGSHEDYPLQAPSVIIVLTGRKLLWIAPGPFRQLLSGCKKAAADLLYRSLCTIDEDILQRLHASFGGQLLELVPGEGAVVPPCRVHAAFNLEPSISVNYTICSQDQWADTLECTVLMIVQHRREAARKAAEMEVKHGGASGSVPGADVSAKAEALLKTATDTGGRNSFPGCVVMFNRGFAEWVEQRIHQDAANVNIDDKALGRLGRVARLLSPGGGLDSLLSTGADAKWRKRMLSAIHKAGIA